MTTEYSFPVWGTQGGGLVREAAPNVYVFVEAPDDFMGLGVGDTMPSEWGIAPANRKAVVQNWDIEDDPDWESPKKKTS